ncbi:MAG: FIST C-terminal domain-containing protein [Acidaminococcales bacterium]|jgi:hypothetical protein|nr:FIST C-terminal domain-containing protein [Acidaminococcales bacterium]
MIKMLTACTREIDYVDEAVEELLGQLDLAHSQLKNSVGIVHCPEDFLDSGVVEALKGKLPFDLVGCTTSGTVACGEFGQLLLTLSVLTSDDVCFAAGISEKVGNDAAGAVKDLYARIEAELPERPKLLLTFVPFSPLISGDEFVAEMDKVSGGAPVFGTRSFGTTIDLTNLYTIYNDQYDTDKIVIVAAGGDISPEFLVAYVSEDRVFKQKAIITAAERNILRGVNNISAADYFVSMGLIEKGNIRGISTMPILINLNDGTPALMRTAFRLADKEGGILFGGEMPVGAILSIAIMDANDVVSSAENTLQEALAKAKGKSLLIYSCAARSFVLGAEGDAEMEKIAQCMAGAPTVYQASYSGGEICPVFDKEGKMFNRFNNNVLIICIL